MDDTTTISNVAKATRQELMDGYRQLLKKYKEATGGQTDAGEQKQILDRIEKYKTESDVAQAIAAARSAVQKGLSEVEAKLAEQFLELKRFNEAIALKDEILKERFEIEQAAGSLIALLQAKEEAARQAENEKMALEQKRKRDEEEYRFSFELQKRKDKEIFEAEKREREKELQAFAAKETEFASLQKQAAEFPAKLEREKQELEARLKAEAAKEKETALLLLQKESDAQKTVFEGRVKTLEAMMEEQKRAIAGLQDQLKASQAQVQEVVIKSIDSASGAKTLDAVNKLAWEQTRAGGRG